MTSERAAVADEIATIDGTGTMAMVDERVASLTTALQREKVAKRKVSFLLP